MALRVRELYSTNGTNNAGGLYIISPRKSRVDDCASERTLKRHHSDVVDFDLVGDLSDSSSQPMMYLQDPQILQQLLHASTNDRRGKQLTKQRLTA